MFKTVKSKILITAIIMLAFLMSAFTCHTVISRIKTKQLMVQNYGASINSFVDEINDRVINAEDNLKSLALIGSLYYQTDRSNELTNRVVTRIFENYPNSLGGGLWYKPYYVDKAKKYVCFYAYRNKDNKVVLDNNFASEDYDYPNQDWYKQILPRIKSKYDIVWSKPYFENLGSYSMMVTAGAGIFVNDELVGIATVDLEIDSLIDEVSKMKPFEKTFSMYKSGNQIKNSFALLGNTDYDSIIAISDPYLDNKNLVGHSLKEIPWYSDNLYEITYFKYHGKKYVPFARNMNNGMILVICIPKSEMFKDIDKFYVYIIFIMLLVGLIVPALLYCSMKRYIINPIDTLIEFAKKISKGEDIQIKIEKPEEFAQLASTYDKMTNDIKSITNERAKMNSELSVAKSIQESSLPNIFPPFPEKTEFDIFASMEAAKEVGGDFYDFFFINETEFMFLIADVSGKGIPAALFMMTVKTLINTFSQINYNQNELFETINKKICETNKHGLFVTMLSGIINIKTGELSIINCGHNLPLVRRVNQKYEYLQLNSNIPLGAFDDSNFEIYKTVLEPGDILYTYTDGVTEASDINDELYGEEKLLECLNSIGETVPSIIAQKVKSSIQNFTDSVPQSDDITMLIFKYNGDKTIVKKFKDVAILDNYKMFCSWLQDACLEWNINDDLKNKLEICAEEIFANTAFYAYSSGNGILEAYLKKNVENLVFEFTDEGIEYNPLQIPPPDFNIPPEKRPIGGLGIFMVKELADSIFYQRRDNKNILTLTFKL